MSLSSFMFLYLYLLKQSSYHQHTFTTFWPHQQHLCHLDFCPFVLSSPFLSENMVLFSVFSVLMKGLWLESQIYFASDTAHQFEDNVISFITIIHTPQESCQKHYWFSKKETMPKKLLLLNQIKGLAKHGSTPFKRKSEQEFPTILINCTRTTWLPWSQGTFPWRLSFLVQQRENPNLNLGPTWVSSPRFCDHRDLNQLAPGNSHLYALRWPAPLL